MNKYPQKDYLLVIRFLEKKLSKSELASFHQWLSASEKNRELLEDIKCLLDYGKSIAYLTEIDEKQAWQIVDKATNESPVTRNMQRSWGGLITKVAASVLLILVFINAWLLIFTPKPDIEYITTSTKSYISELYLPDSTKVFLNENTSLTYPKEFEPNNRQVFLEGEAFFELVPHDRRPFMVNTNWGTVEGNENQFDVSAYREMEYVEVIVETGKIHFHKPKNASSPDIFINKGEKIIYTSQGDQELSACCIGNNHLAWKTGFFHFYNSDIQTIFREFENLYHVKIQSPEVHQTVNGNFPYCALDTILQKLQKQLPFTYQRDGNLIAIQWHN